MKKLLLLFLFLPLFAPAQTIPNGNFESWFYVGWSENPEFWITGNNELQTTVAKDSLSYEGEIAMRVTAKPTGLGDYGEAYNLFPINAIPPALNFYAKTQVEFGAVAVEITFLNQDTEIYTESWENTTNMDDYTLVSIPLNQLEPSVITHARIIVYAYVGDLIAGTAWISVDAMEFGEPLKVNRNEPRTFKVYPNPASENITIQSVGSSLGNLKIVDAQGKVVIAKQVQENITTIAIQNLSPGIYTISSDKGDLKASTFIVK